MTSARVTLPYDESKLRVPEASLRLATMDRATGLWVPVTGPVTVDAQANTVTMDVRHFSLLAVVQEAQGGFWSDEALARMFGSTPVRCVAEGSPGSGAGVDVAFVIDTSGSMATNDPGAARVARFVEKTSQAGAEALIAEGAVWN